MAYNMCMSLIFTSRSFSTETKRDAIATLVDNTVPDRDFYLLVIGAVALAISAIFTDSIAVLIASMIVAPLAYPILGLGLGIIVSDWPLLLRCILMLIASLVFAILLAFIATFFFGHVRVDPVFISFESNLYFAIIIALISGFIAAYGLVRSKVGGAMTGIGIAVSLMPPLVMTGISLADGVSVGVSPSHTFLVFLLNVIGILMGSMITFGLMGFRRVYKQKS